MLLAEQLLVLSQTPQAERASTRWPENRQLAIAVVAELAVMGRLRFLAGLVFAPDAFPTSSTVLTDALAVLERRKELSVRHAVDAVAASHNDLRQELLDSMVRRGLMEVRAPGFPRFWRRDYQPARDASHGALDGLRRFALSGDPADYRSAALFALADLLGLLPGLLAGGELALGRKSLQQLEAEYTGTRATTDPMSERARLLLALTHPGG